MKRFRLFTLLCVLIALALGVYFVRMEHQQAAQAVMPSECDIIGPEVKTHGHVTGSTQTFSDMLYDTSALSANDVWAVGEYDTISGSFPLVEHWNGSQWKIVPTPPSTQGKLYSVRALSAKDVWATGWAETGGSTAGLVEHWNGSNWSIVQTLSIGVVYDFYSLAAVSPTNVWVVGSYASATGPTQALIEHWDGSTWSIIPALTSTSGLGSITALSANNIWAVGCGISSTAGYSTTLVEHWNGTAWSVVPSPNRAFASYLNSVTAISANDIWAAGGFEILQGSAYGFERLVEHWDGSAWKIVPSPPGPNSRANSLCGASAVSSTNVWATGTVLSADDGQHVPQGFSEHWNGTKWSLVSIAHKGPSTAVYDYLCGITTLADNNAWAAGFYSLDGLGTVYTLIEHWDGTKWSIVPSPNQ